MILTFLDLTRYLLTAQDLVHGLCVGGGRSWPVFWYATSVRTSRPPFPMRQAYENPSSITLIPFGIGHCWGPENNHLYHPKIGCVGTAVHDSVSRERIALCPPHLRSSQSGVLPELCSLRNFSYIHPHVVFKFDHVRRHLIELQRGSCIPGIFYCMYIAVFGYF